MLMNERST